MSCEGTSLSGQSGSLAVHGCSPPRLSRVRRVPPSCPQVSALFSSLQGNSWWAGALVARALQDGGSGHYTVVTPATNEADELVWEHLNDSTLSRTLDVIQFAAFASRPTDAIDSPRAELLDWTPGRHNLLSPVLALFVRDTERPPFLGNDLVVPSNFPGQSSSGGAPSGDCVGGKN